MKKKEKGKKSMGV